MGDKEGLKTGVSVGAGAALGTALALLATRGAAAKPPEGVVSLDEAAMLLLQSIAQSGVDIASYLPDILEELGNIKSALSGGTGNGYTCIVPNTEKVMTTRVSLTTALTPLQLPDIPVPDDMSLVVKSWPFNPVAGLVYVGDSAASCINANSSYPLIRNEFRALRVNNAELLWVSADIVPAWVILSVEVR